MSAQNAALPDISTIGPVQVLTVAFDTTRFKGEILPELERLKKAGIIRIIDMLLVRKDSTGAVATVTATDLDWEEASDFGAMVGGLIGWGIGGAEGAAVGAIAGAAEFADGHALDEQDKRDLIDAIAPGTMAAIALIEHLWAKPLRAAIARADGYEIANDWLKLDELIALGMSMAEPGGSRDATDPRGTT